MSLSRKFFSGSALFISAIAWAAAPLSMAAAAPVLVVAHAGSMGAVMDKGLGPAFAASHHVDVHAIGRGSYGLAHLIAGKHKRPDVFIAITPGPIRIVQKAGLMAIAVPVASTQMVIAYSPKSRFAGQFKAAAKGDLPWYKVLEQKDLRFGRTDPRTDPQGRNIVLTMQLAQRYYQQPHLVKEILGSILNKRQIFTEASLLTRLEAGQMDATSGYLSAVISHHLPYIKLPEEINLDNPAMMEKWYGHAGFELPGEGSGAATRVKVQPLVFYAGVLENAARPTLARQFIAFLQSAKGRKLLADYGYSTAKGKALRPVD